MTNSTHFPCTSQPTRMRLYPGVSCVTFEGMNSITPVNYFDVKDEDYLEGNLTGAKILWECLREFKTEDFDGLSSIVDAAGAILNAQYTPYISPDKRGAAAGFIHLLFDFVEHAASKVDVNAFMQEHFSRHEAMLESDLADVKAGNAQFVASMKAQVTDGVATHFGQASIKV